MVRSSLLNGVVKVIFFKLKDTAQSDAKQIIWLFPPPNPPLHGTPVSFNPCTHILNDGCGGHMSYPTLTWNLYIRFVVFQNYIPGTQLMNNLALTRGTRAAAAGSAASVMCQPRRLFVHINSAHIPYTPRLWAPLNTSRRWYTKVSFYFKRVKSE
jgi:hypothetical protein